LDLVAVEYQEEFLKQGKHLVGEINISPVENATYQIGPGNLVRLIVYGGLIWANEMNDLGLVIVACHEIGHVYSAVVSKKGIAVEGEADYFSASECAAKILRKLPASPNPTLPSEVLEQCKSASYLEPDICEKINGGALAVSRLRARIAAKPDPSFLTPDPLIVSQTSDVLTVQCGLDTLYAASIGRPRPLCWFHP
jgi:hypothetical protein